jgi:uncharacterized protein YdhG (YjbR/CyaY superfamily)
VLVKYRDWNTFVESGMATNQSGTNAVDEYISNFPGEVQQILQQLRRTIRDAAPDAQETINYGIPTFKQDGNLVHFAAYKSHIGFYPTPSGIEEFHDELARYETAKGSVKFPLDESLPLDLIRKIVHFRVKENKQKAAAKKI